MKTRTKFFKIDDRMPVLKAISEEFEASQPFKGLKIAMCLHITKETMALVYAIKAGGAEIVLCASNPLSTQDPIADILRREGIKVYGKRGDNRETYKNNLRLIASLMQYDYEIDDGADLTVALHNQKSHDLPKGGLEETTAGVNRIKRMSDEGKLKYPIIAVNDTPTKHLFDNVYGTGQSVIDAIMRATGELLAGKTFVIAGYGNCGKGLAQRAKGMGCNVIVTEIDPVKALQAHMDGFRVMPMHDAAPLGDVFVTVTGNINVINRKDLLIVKLDAILANAGHFDVEIDVKTAKELGLNILGEGRLVNLACADGHPAEVMDMSFANQALCLEYLTTQIGKRRVINPSVFNVPSNIDNRIARMKLKSLGLEIDELTPEQSEYLKSWQ